MTNIPTPADSSVAWKITTPDASHCWFTEDAAEVAHFKLPGQGHRIERYTHTPDPFNNGAPLDPLDNLGPRPAAGLLPSSEGAVTAAALKRLIGSAVNYPGTARSQSWVKEVFGLIDTLAAPGAAIAAREQEAAAAGELQPMALKICSMLTDEISRLYPFTGKTSHGLAKAEEVRTNIAAVRDVAQELNRKLLASPSGAGLGGAVASSEAVERAAFETWLCEGGNYEPEWLDGRTTSAGWSYSNADTENMWQAWLARAALASQPGCAVEGEAVTLTWAETGFDKRHCHDPDGKVRGYIERGMSHTRWEAVAGRTIGEYMTEAQAKAAVERAALQVNSTEMSGGA